jgi:hypothetical protein
MATDDLGPSAAGEQTPTGHTAQYETLARALGYAAGLMEDDLEELTERGYTVSAADFRLEARFVTVTVLAVAMTESLANTILALATNGHYKDPKGRRPKLVARWQSVIPERIGCAPFLSAALAKDLTLLGAVRNSITHSNPRLFSGDTVIADGNSAWWDHLDADTVRMFVRLPLELLASVPQTSQYVWPLAANDYWLQQAISRGKGEAMHSPNQWRPRTKLGRARGQV